MITTILLGSNLGDSLGLLREAVEKLSVEVGKIVKKTEILNNKAWGYDSENDFYNQIVQIETTLKPLDLLDVIEEIERNLGRLKQNCDWRIDRVYEDRTIDIDILLYGEMINGEFIGLEFENNRLKIPHPRMNEREFVKTLMDQL